MGTASQGSGGEWVRQRQAGGRAVAVTAKTASPITGADRPLFGLSLWEHAYVLDYRDARGRYVEAVWNVVDWAAVASHMR